MIKGRVAVKIELPEADDVLSMSANEIIRDLEGVGKEVASKAKDSGAFKDKTKRLRRSIKVKKVADKSGGLMDVYVLATAPHAHLVHNGHAVVVNGEVVKHVSGRPFLKEAMVQVLTKTPGAYEGD